MKMTGKFPHTEGAMALCLSSVMARFLKELMVGKYNN